MKKSKLINDAFEKYNQLQERKIHPDGEFDSAGRWYPSESESQKCCEGIRSPSRSYPYSYMVHCRSLQHVCNQLHVDFEKAKVLLQEQKKVEKELKLKIKTKVFKIVAVVGNSYKSVYDNSAWKLNIKRNGRKYFVYTDIEIAKERIIENEFPSESKNIEAKKVILECMAYGTVKPSGHGWGKHYCLNIKPIRKIVD